MRPLLFTFKRLSLLAGRGARALASLVSLTPQRCDLLLRLYPEPLIQRDLAFELGVVRSVVSKMVTALEDLGLVIRKGIEGDRRLRLVTLTERAFRVISVLLDNDLPESLGHTVQFTFERELLDRFRTPLHEQAVGILDFSDRDHRELLHDMHDEIADCSYQDFVGYDYSPDVPPWRQKHPDGGYGCGERVSPSDATVAERHRNAGIPLDERQRRRKRRPQPRPNAPPPPSRHSSPPYGPRDAPPPAAPALL